MTASAMERALRWATPSPSAHSTSVLHRRFRSLVPKFESTEILALGRHADNFPASAKGKGLSDFVGEPGFFCEWLERFRKKALDFILSLGNMLRLVKTVLGVAFPAASKLHRFPANDPVSHFLSMLCRPRIPNHNRIRSLPEHRVTTGASTTPARLDAQTSQRNNGTSLTKSFRMCSS